MQTENETHNLASAPQKSLRPVINMPAAKEPAQENPFDGGKKIKDTFGGRLTNFFIYYVLGFIGNSSASLVLTYYANPKPQVKKVREAFVNGAANLIPGKEKGGAMKYLSDGVRSTTEILLMMVSGFTVTGLMTPLVKRKEKIAYWINQKFGKDTEVQTEEMKKHTFMPTTQAEFIEHEIKERVEQGQTGWDLWKARFTTTLMVLVGDAAVNAYNRKVEQAGHKNLSTDTWAWNMGGVVHKIVPHKIADRWIGWFSRHGASIDDVKENMGTHYNRILDVEKAAHPGIEPNKDRLVFREQSRLVTKEVGWTLILATFVDKMTEGFRKRRVKKQTAKAIEALKTNGTITPDYEVSMNDGGEVKIVARQRVPYEAESTEMDAAKQWTGQFATPASTKLETMEQRPAAATAGMGV